MPASDDWNACAVPWKLPITVGGMRSSVTSFVELADRLAQRHTRFQVERQRHRRQLSLVGDRQRADAAFDTRHRRQRHQRARADRT